jgi:hypothetical protein
MHTIFKSCIRLKIGQILTPGKKYGRKRIPFMGARDIYGNIYDQPVRILRRANKEEYTAQFKEVAMSNSTVMDIENPKTKYYEIISD